MDWCILLAPLNMRYLDDAPRQGDERLLRFVVWPDKEERFLELLTLYEERDVLIDFWPCMAGHHSTLPIYDVGQVLRLHEVAP